jgi:hypothetical protein
MVMFAVDVKCASSGMVILQAARELQFGTHANTPHSRYASISCARKSLNAQRKESNAAQAVVSTLKAIEKYQKYSELYWKSSLTKLYISDGKIENQCAANLSGGAVGLYTVVKRDVGNKFASLETAHRAITSTGSEVKASKKAQLEAVLSTRPRAFEASPSLADTSVVLLDGSAIPFEQYFSDQFAQQMVLPTPTHLIGVGGSGNNVMRYILSGDRGSVSCKDDSTEGSKCSILEKMASSAAATKPSMDLFMRNQSGSSSIFDVIMKGEYATASVLLKASDIPENATFAMLQRTHSYVHRQPSLLPLLYQRHQDRYLALCDELGKIDDLIDATPPASCDISQLRQHIERTNRIWHFICCNDFKPLIKVRVPTKGVAYFNAMALYFWDCTNP